MDVARGIVSGSGWVAVAKVAVAKVAVAEWQNVSGGGSDSGSG
jgi:hypothetical protein